MNNPKDYTNHSGGAKGADKQWDVIGREFGVTNHIHYRPSDTEKMDAGTRNTMLVDVWSAAAALGRPHYFKGLELVHRNWFQAKYSEAIFAIGIIIEPGKKDFKGFVNETGKQIVAGGTGWAVEMAIQKNKSVYVFDQEVNIWFKWIDTMFVSQDTPILTQQFSGIGTRQITCAGDQAIRDVYIKTFPNGEGIKPKQ